MLIMQFGVDALDIIKGLVISCKSNSDGVDYLQHLNAPQGNTSSRIPCLSFETINPVACSPCQ